MSNNAEITCLLQKVYKYYFHDCSRRARVILDQFLTLNYHSEKVKTARSMWLNVILNGLALILINFGRFKTLQKWFNKAKKPIYESI